MTKQWNFIIGNKLITIYDTDKSMAYEKAHALYEELKAMKGISQWKCFRVAG